MTDELNQIEKGDWVRFQRGYSTVIGEVQYRRKRIAVSDELVTDQGSVSIDQILEIRTIRCNPDE